MRLATVRDGAGASETVREHLVVVRHLLLERSHGCIHLVGWDLQEP
jgi:hypothetical protein